MQTALAIAISLHLLSGTFWAGSNFTAARPSISGERLFFPQMGAAVVAIGSGHYLWMQLHQGNFGAMEKALAFAAAAAILAFILQAVVAGPAVIALRKGKGGPSTAARVKLGNRIAAVLLAITVIGMAIARYV